MKASVSSTPWCRLSALRFEVAPMPPDLDELLDLGVRDIGRYTAAEPRRSEPWLIASVRLSITRMKG
jgi:hypothetical protein